MTLYGVRRPHSYSCYHMYIDIWLGTLHVIHLCTLVVLIQISIAQSLATCTFAWIINGSAQFHIPDLIVKIWPPLAGDCSSTWEQTSHTGGWITLKSTTMDLNHCVQKLPSATRKPCYAVCIRTQKFQMTSFNNACPNWVMPYCKPMMILFLNCCPSKSNVIKDLCDLYDLKPRKIFYRSYKHFCEADYLTDLSFAPFHVADIFDDIDDIAWFSSALIKMLLMRMPQWRQKA